MRMEIDKHKKWDYVRSLYYNNLKLLIRFELYVFDNRIVRCDFAASVFIFLEVNIVNYNVYLHSL